MIKMKIKFNNLGKIAISEVLILIIGIIAFSWMVGLSLPGGII
jgi:hypothetical protein